jgi:hypothetical protein
MSRRLLLIYLLSTILCFVAEQNFASNNCYGQGLLVSLNEATSFHNGNDPYKEEYKNSFPGQRYPMIIGSSETEFLFDNFRTSRSENSGHEWTSALINSQKAAKAYFMICTFNTKIAGFKKEAGHGQLMIRFNDGGLAIANTGEQNSGGTNSDGQNYGGTSISGLICSFEAFREKGVSFDPVAGANGAFGSGFVLSSAKDGLERAARFCKRVIIYELNLDSEQVKKLCYFAIREALNRERFLTEPYHTFNNTCSSNIFDLLNKVIPKQDKLTKFKLSPYKQLFTLSYKEPGKHLSKAGLVSEFLELPSGEAIKEYISEILPQLPREEKFLQLYNQ